MPLKPHPTDPDKMVYVSRQYDIPQLQGVTVTQRTWVGLTQEERINIAYKANGNEVLAVELTEAKLKEENDAV